MHGLDLSSHMHTQCNHHSHNGIIITIEWSSIHMHTQDWCRWERTTQGFTTSQCVWRGVTWMCQIEPFQVGTCIQVHWTHTGSTSVCHSSPLCPSSYNSGRISFAPPSPNSKRILLCQSSCKLAMDPELHIQGNMFYSCMTFVVLPVMFSILFCLGGKGRIGSVALF